MNEMMSSRSTGSDRAGNYKGNARCCVMCCHRIACQGQGWAINAVLNSGYGSLSKFTKEKADNDDDDDDDENSLRKFHKGEGRLIIIIIISFY